MLDRTPYRRDALESGEHPTPYRARRERQKLVVRTKKGEVHYGMSFDLNRKSTEFHLDLQNKRGESLNKTERIKFEDVKAVFYVKSFDGRFNPDDFPAWEKPEMRAVAVKFLDGEVFIGHPTHTHWMEEPRFYLLPGEGASNNLMVLVERSAVSSVHDAKSYARKQQQEYEYFKQHHAKIGISEEECRGDFHFSRHEYKDALHYYREVREQDPQNERITRKLCATKYNLGIRHIKNHDYVQALRYMDLVLKVDPNHAQAKEKAAQLRAHIAKHAKG